MTLGGRIGWLLVALHLPLAALAWIAARASTLGIVAAELAVLLSLTVSLRLLRVARSPRELAKTGRELLAERDFTTRFRAIGQRDVDDLVALYNQLSEELRRERLRLEERDLLLGLLVEASPGGVLLCDLDARVELANPAAARLLGTTPEALRGRALSDLPPPFAAAATGLAVGGARILPLAGGRRVRLVRGEFADRGFARSFLLVEELTEELRASEKAAYEKVIRLVSHEVNNSAGAIGSLLESSRSLVDELSGPARADLDEALEVSARRIRHLAAFVDGFAAVVRLPEPRRSPLAADLLLSELAALHRGEADRRQIRLEVEPAAAPLPEIEADREQLEQALVNLLRNALEATPAGGEVRLAARRVGARGELDGEAVELSIRDSGAGIPDRVTAQLFTPFFSTKRDGRGLGLTFVEEVARRHGAGFALENHPAGGAVARLRLPLAT